MINDLWYKNAVVYSLGVDTYMDANGDGVGDFEGLMRRLDYLNGLGVSAIWLMPFQKSPFRDNGYDISDYYTVDPRYGTLGDFVAFTRGVMESGHFKAGDPLQPVRTATTVRVRDGRTITTDGPFAETKEQLGGYYLVDCANLDEATAIAAKIPSAELGSIEVRPIMQVDMGLPG